MMLVTGGVASGKRTILQGLGYEPGDIASADGLDLTLPAGVDEMTFLVGIADQLAACDAVVCTEVGSGVVPLDAGQRAWRERAGRLACLLAERADCVVRMVCGIPQVLKGELVRRDGGLQVDSSVGGDDSPVADASARGDGRPWSC